MDLNRGDQGLKVVGFPMFHPTRAQVTNIRETIKTGTDELKNPLVKSQMRKCDLSTCADGRYFVQFSISWNLSREL